MDNKILILVRHGKAIDGKKFLGNDFDRLLLENWKKEFKQLTYFFQKNTIFSPQIILTSSVKRCFETAEILRKTYKLKKSSLISTKNLYYGDWGLWKIENYFNESMKIEEQVNILALVWHNWTITDFASELIWESCVSMENEVLWF